VVLIVGMLGRKDAASFFPCFAALNPSVWTTSFESESATPPELLAEAARAAGLSAEAANGVADALTRALAAPGTAPHVIICGSLHFVGDVLAMSPQTWPT
jgi:dihydrofolate synthase/folylpolyglutamate synthase